MRLKDLSITAGIAAVTMVFTLALFGSTSVDARRGAKRILRADGVEMTVRATRTTRRPTAELKLVNTTENTVQVNPRIALYTEAPGSRHARMVSPPRQRWSDDELYALEPGETRTVQIDPGKRVPRQSLAWFTIRSGKRHTQTESFVARAPRKPGKVARSAKKRARKFAKANARPMVVTQNNRAQMARAY